MAGAPVKYRPTFTPYKAPDENLENYLRKFLPWVSSEFDAVYKDVSQAVSVNVEVSAPLAPYDGMMRIFVDTGTYGWSPGAAGTGLYIYFGGAWTQITAL
jgi:hypothetical protein